MPPPPGSPVGLLPLKALPWHFTGPLETLFALYQVFDRVSCLLGLRE